ncbi:MAG: BON domain-containing protein [Armatimonadetes bacterium]|nr:BON domain-containing protein [Armatimonadota bacterium]
MRGRMLAAFLTVMICSTAFAQRTDSEIRAEVQRRIGAGITISVQSGSVSLSGMVTTLARRLNAVNQARRTVGVREVFDRITVVPAEKIPDDQVASSVRQSLAGSLSKSESAAISVGAQNGIVTLTGTLPCSYQKQVAGTLVSLIPGVTDLRNEIVVRPKKRRSDADILSDLKARFSQNPLIPAAQINVTVADGVVSLTGIVGGFVQADQAESVARFTPGVVDVQNRLFVSGGGNVTSNE